MDQLHYATQHLEPPNSKTMRSDWANGQGKDPVGSQVSGLGLLVSLLHISRSPIGQTGTAQLLFLADMSEGQTHS